MRVIFIAFLIDFIHDIRYLCPRLRTDAIKSLSRGFSAKNCHWKKSRLSLCKQTTENGDLFMLKTIMSKYGWKQKHMILVEVIIVTFLYAVATLDVLMANSNDANLAN